MQSASAMPSAPSVAAPPPSAAFGSSAAASSDSAGAAPAAGGFSLKGLASLGAGTQSTRTKEIFQRLTKEVSKIYVGQEELVLGVLVALFSSGHVLIESVPGLGKTLFVRTLGRVLGLNFGRIQFTADLMPSDITGAPIFDMKTQEFRFRPGPCSRNCCWRTKSTVRRRSRMRRCSKSCRSTV
jgi:MoxR-like ATPase